MLRKLFDCYSSLFLETLCIKNNKAYLKLPANMTTLLLICALIGLIRNVLQVIVRTPFFYCFDPDIITIMMLWPIQLFLFPAMLFCILLRLAGYQNSFNIKSIFALFFSLQILHVFIPLFDWAGNRIGIPYYYTLGSQEILTPWYTNMLYLTPGILLAWVISIYVIIKTLHQQYQINWTTIALSIFILIAIFIPTYFIYPAFNSAFNQVFGIWPINPLSIRIYLPTFYIFWGNVVYLFLTSLIGVCYYNYANKNNKPGPDVVLRSIP